MRTTDGVKNKFDGYVEESQSNLFPNTSVVITYQYMLFSSKQTLTSEPMEFIKAGTKLVIDHDGGADDSMAIFLALLYEECCGDPSLIGLTTVNGNVNESQVFINSQRILDIAGRRDVPIYRGSACSLVTTTQTDAHFGYNGLGDNEYIDFIEIKAQDEHAAVALIEMSKEFPGELIVMAIGPLTNIALAIRLDPEFIGRLAQLYIGAGHVYSEAVNTPEFNANIDVEAYHVVAESSRKDKVTVVPFSQIRQSLNNTIKWRTDVLGRIPTKIMTAQNSFERISLTKVPFWYPLDPAVSAIVLDNRIVNEVKYSKHDIVLCGDQRGITTNDFESKEPNVKLIYSANLENYTNFLLYMFRFALS